MNVIRWFALPLALGALLVARPAVADEGPALQVGSEAPALDVEHWFQKGDETFPKVSEFNDGKVYVIEFWATWCPPCVASMPHLAELQKKYSDAGVRIVSVSDEDVETIEKFLEREVPDGSEGDEVKTFGEVTNAYSLTTDPDQSVFRDYMVAAEQNGIPTAFIVGKSGLVEWLGHPMKMDDPLEQVLQDRWDREAFSAELAKQREMEQVLAEATALYRDGDHAKALEAIGGSMETVEDPMMLMQLSSAVVAISTQGSADSPVVTKTISRLAEMGTKAPEELRPYCFDMQARLLKNQGKLQQAIEAQQMAVKIAEGPIRERMSSLLDDLKKLAEEPADDAETPPSDEGDSGQ